MSEKLFLTQEIGSLAKPNWHVKKLSEKELDGKDFQEIDYWTKKVNLGEKTRNELIELLKYNLDEESEQKIREISALYAIKLQETAGLDLVFNGEQWRSEMYQNPISNLNGFKFYGNVRSWDNKYYLKAAVTSQPQLKTAFHVPEFLFTKKHSKRIVKVPITGAYTLMDWSYNEFYLTKWKTKKENYKEARKSANREFVLELAKNVLQPHIKSLVEKGAEIIQIDEPAATTKPDEIDIFVESFNESVKGVNAKFTCHICFSDYSLLFPKILEMKKCKQFTWEFANQDTGTRNSYEKILNLFKEYNDNREIGLGVLNVHSNEIESPELVKDRILFSAKLLGDPKKIYVNPDCGLRTRTWEMSFNKLSNMVKGAELARNEFE